MLLTGFVPADRIPACGEGFAAGVVRVWWLVGARVLGLSGFLLASAYRSKPSQPATEDAAS
jgi:hypothetical protein